MTELKITTMDQDQYWSLLNAGDHLRILEELFPIEDDAAASLQVLVGVALYKSARYAEAESRFRIAQKTDGQNPVAGLYLVLCLVHRGHYPEAAKLLKGGTALLPHWDWLEEFLNLFWNKRHFVYESAAEGPLPARATEAIKRVAAMSEIPSPEAIEGEETLNPFLFLARIILRKSSPQRSAIGAVKRQAQKIADQGEEAFFRGDITAARRLFAEAHRIRPLNEATAGNYAFLLLQEGRATEAFEVLKPFAFRQDTAVHPMPDTLVYTAWALIDTGTPTDGLRLLATVEPEGPEDFGSHFVSALGWKALGDMERHRRALRAALGPYFIDTWEIWLRPYIHAVADWLERGAPGDTLEEEARNSDHRS